jgi:hypothetical protein
MDPDRPSLLSAWGYLPSTSYRPALLRAPTSPFQLVSRPLASLRIRPKTRIAVARLLVLSPVHAFWSICQAYSFGVCGALERDGAGCPASACFGAYFQPANGGNGLQERSQTP